MTCIKKVLPSFNKSWITYLEWLFLPYLKKKNSCKLSKTTLRILSNVYMCTHAFAFVLIPVCTQFRNFYDSQWFSDQQVCPSGKNQQPVLDSTQSDKLALMALLVLEDANGWDSEISSWEWIRFSSDGDVLLAEGTQWRSSDLHDREMASWLKCFTCFHPVTRSACELLFTIKCSDLRRPCGCYVC